MKRTLLLILMLVALVGLWPVDRAWSYSSLFYLDNDGNTVSGSSNVLKINTRNFTIYDRSSSYEDSNDNFSKSYIGYTNSDFAGYYIGTVSGNTDGNANSFETIISYYLGFDSSLKHIKVESDDFEGLAEGSHTEGTTTLTVTFDDFKDGEPISGTWSLNNSYGFGFYAVKGGPEFALYFVDPAQSSGKWTTRHLVNKGGEQPALSHFSGDPNPMPVPEPTTLLLLGAGLLGLGFVGRRRSNR